MHMVIPGILFKTECRYEKQVVNGKKEDVFQGFSNEGEVVFSNVEGLKKGDRVLVNPWGGAEVGSMSTKKHKFIIIEQRDVLLRLDK